MSVRPSSANRQADQENPAWHAIAIVYRVVGTRGRRRSVIVVRSCPFRCGTALHVHSGKDDFVEGKRTAPCGGGRYQIHTGVLEGEAPPS